MYASGLPGRRKQRPGRERYSQETNSKFEYRYPKILEHFKEFAARDITPEAIESFLKSLHQIEWIPVEGSAKYDPKAKRTRVAKKQVETDAPLSASSKNQYRTILSGIFSFNIKRGRYDVNPVKAVRQEKEPAGRDSLMMPDEFRQFRAKCVNGRESPEPDVPTGVGQPGAGSIGG